LNLPARAVFLIKRRKTSLTEVPVVSIVDDDETFRRATARLISSLGYAVAAFGSAEEFLKSDRLADTACLISDVHMPGMSGIELQNRLIANGQRLPMIFITAFPETKFRAEALAAGALGFLSKPFSEDKLIMYLGQALEMRGA
jgi:FixJ family two-component response regulator